MILFSKIKLYFIKILTAAGVKCPGGCDYVPVWTEAIADSDQMVEKGKIKCVYFDNMSTV